MTTVCYRGGYLVADSSVSCGSEGVGYRLGTQDKVTKLKGVNSTIYWASSGDVGIEDTIEEWLLAYEVDAKPTMEFSEKAEFDIIAVFVCPMHTRVLTLDSKSKVFEKWNADYWAIGTGEEFALGAMAAGASAAGAVEAATKHDLASCMPVQGFNVYNGNEIRIK